MYGDQVWKNSLPGYTLGGRASWCWYFRLLYSVYVLSLKSRIPASQRFGSIHFPLALDMSLDCPLEPPFPKKVWNERCLLCNCASMILLSLLLLSGDSECVERRDKKTEDIGSFKWLRWFTLCRLKNRQFARAHTSLNTNFLYVGEWQSECDWPHARAGYGGVCVGTRVCLCLG